MINELKTVILTTDVPDHGLKAGDLETTDCPTPPEDDRSDRFGWDEDDVTITDPKEG